jgi:hypothetical protein
MSDQQILEVCEILEVHEICIEKACEAAQLQGWERSVDQTARSVQ